MYKKLFEKHRFTLEFIASSIEFSQAASKKGTLQQDVEGDDDCDWCYENTGGQRDCYPNSCNSKKSKLAKLENYGGYCNWCYEELNGHRLCDPYDCYNKH